MKDLNNKFSIRRVACLLSYSFKEWKEGFVYLPLACLIIGITHILYSIAIGNPNSIDNNDPSSFINVTNYYENVWGFNIIWIIFLVFIFFQLFSIIKKKEKSTFYRSIPSTASEKFCSLITEYLFIIFLIITIHIFCIFLDGIVCTLYGYNEWSDILPAIKSYFTPELKIDNGLVDFGFGSGKLLDESWMNDRLFIWGVSFNSKMMYLLFFITLLMSSISRSTNPLVTSSKRWIKNIAMARTISLIIGISIAVVMILIFANYQDAFLFVFGFGPWCYNNEYGWIIQAIVLLLWLYFNLSIMYNGIKKGEAR